MKERYNIKITDIQLTILSDEPEEFVHSTVAQLNDRISDLCVRNKRCSKLDAALLCALDSTGEKIKADKKIKNLEAQISLYEATNKRLREEIEALRKSASAPTAAAETVSEAEPAAAEEPQTEDSTDAEIPAVEEAQPAEQPKEEPVSEPEIKQLSIEDIPAPETAGETKEEMPEAAVPQKPAEEAPLHDDKLRQIEQLLRRRSEEHSAHAASAETKKEEAAPEESAAPASRDEKLRQIEDLLRKNGSAKSLSEVLHNAIGN